MLVYLTCIMLTKDLMDGLQKTRLKNGLTLRVMAELTKIAPANFSNIERGLTTPTLTTRQQIERVLGKINWLEVPFINTEPRDPPMNWNDCEREFRYFLHCVASLPADERKAFLSTSVKHLKKMNTKQTKMEEM